MKRPTHLGLDGLHQPKSINGLKILLHLQRLKGNFLLIMGPESGQKSGTFDVSQPHSLPVNIACIFLLKFVVGMQHHLGAVVEPHQRAFLPLPFSRFD